MVLVIGFVGQCDFEGIGSYQVVFQYQVVLFEGVDVVFVVCGFVYYGEGGIFVCFECIQRIGEESDFYEVGVLLSLVKV